MDSIISNMKSTFGGKTKIITTGLIALLFILVSIFIYYRYVVPRINATYVSNKEYIKKGDDTTADMYFFYTNWCPHCKTAMPVWNKFKEHVNEKGHSSNVKINFIEVDCDKDKKTADKFNVTGYPTIKLSYKDEIIEYDAKPDMEHLQQFLDESLN